MRFELRLLAVVGVLTLAACNKISQVGQLPESVPTAKAATVGQEYTTDSSGVLHTTVRAGADVVLSGGDSLSNASDTGIPVISWTWTQVNPGSTPVDLVKRTQDISSFTAPQVTTPTTLTFQLTVTNANGASAQTQAQVVVEPVRDADHFLTYLNTADSFTLTAVTSATLPASAQAAYNATVPFTVTVTKLATYTDNNGVQHSGVPVGPPTVYNGSWSAQLGSGGSSCSDPRNPKLQIQIPKLNLDDLIYDSSGNSTGQRLSDVMQTSDIDRDPADSQIPRAFVSAQIQIASTGSLPAGTVPGFCVGDPSTVTAQADTTLTADALIAASNSTSNLYDTSASAHTYYQTIDPQGTKSTLSAWLSANGFNPTASGWNADAHAIYTNNYDLGFGRDMYMKFGACDSGFSATSITQFGAQTYGATTAQALQQLIGHCDVASVVVNYVGVQAAAENTNAIVAVAMEYSASPGSTGRFVKFYVFAPDTRSGEFQRVTSVDLDHRGQKPVPQNCVVCHGGTPASPASLTAAAPSYPKGTSGIPGDLGAGFIPWDLDSFWYSDTDPGFSTKPEDAGLKATYTETSQQNALKLLNVGAYLTMADPNRFAIDRELLEGWYGGAGMPGGFTGTFVPDGWQPGNNGNPANSDTIYKDVFERDCRMCHALQAPAAGYNLASGGAQGSGSASCTSTATVSNLGASSDQFPMGCYWQWANAPKMAAMLSEGRMPYARRTADRLWTDAGGDPNSGTVSAVGAELITQLNSEYAAAGNSTTTVVAPGTANAVIPPFSTVTPYDVLSFPPLQLAIDGDATDGGLISQPSWQVCLDPGTGSCADSTHHVAVVDASAIPATFQVPTLTGTFLVELDSGTTQLATQTLTVQNNPPVIGTLPPSAGVAVQGSFNLTAAGLITGGNGPASSLQWWVSGLSNLATPGGTCTAAAPCTVGATPTITLTETSTTPTTAAYTLNVTDVVGNNVSASNSNIPVYANLTISNVIGYVTENTGPYTVLATDGTTLDLLGGNQVGSGQTVQAQVSCDNGTTWVTSCPLGTNTFGTGTLTLAGTNVSYTPPPGFSTHPPGGGTGATPTNLAGAPLVPLSVQYRLQTYEGSAQLYQTPPETLYIQVRARVSFSTDVVAGVFQAASYPSGGATCDSSNCHNSTNPGAVGLISYSDQVQTIYCNLVGCPTPQTPMTESGKFVNSADATNTTPASVLLRYPTTAQHPGGERCNGGFTVAAPMVAIAPCDLTAILMWIEDGANDF
jgi:hypothetical protein